jgi:hypothetical protein
MSYARGMNPRSWGNHKSGPECPLWSDEKIISSHGYVKLRVGAEHPLADPNGYAYEHLVVCAGTRWHAGLRRNTAAPAWCPSAYSRVFAWKHTDSLRSAIDAARGAK